MATRKSSIEKKVPRSKAHCVLVGDPFFLKGSDRVQYNRHLAKALDQESLTHGSKPLSWKPAPAPNPSWLYVDETDVGVMPIFNFSATSYYARQGLLQPLEELFPDYNTRFLESGWRKGVVGAHLYSVPLHISIRLLFYRRDLLAKHGFEPPLTWDQLIAQAKAIQKAEKDPQLHGLLFNFNALLRFSVFLDHIWSAGKDLYESTPRWKLDRRGLEAALLRVKSFFKSGITPADALASDYEWSYKEFLAGHGVFLHNWSDGIRMIRELPLEEQERFGWCALPSVDAKVPGRSMLGGPSYVIPKATRYPGGAGRILQRLMQKDFQSWYAENLGWPFPGSKSTYFDAKVQRAKPYLVEAESLLSRGKLLEECVYLQQHHMDWQSIGSQEITRFLEGHSSSSEAVQRLEQRLAPLLPSPPWSGLTGRALELIQSRLEQPLTVGTLAKELQVSPEHLSRVFKAQAGQGLHESIHLAKIERAKALLKQSPLAVSEVAYRLSYKTPQHFSRIFKELAGRSPKDYRS
jgi:multiple sugar transport system substrate-binding protein